MKWKKMRDVIVSAVLLLALMVPLAAIGQYDLGYDYDYGTIWDNKNVGGNFTNNYAKWVGMKYETPMSSGLFGFTISWETLRHDEPEYSFGWGDMNDASNDAKWVDIEDVTPVDNGRLVALTAPWNILGLNEPKSVGKIANEGADEGVEWEKMKDADEGVEWEKMEDVTPVGSGLIVLTVASVCYVGIKKRKHLKIRKLKKVLLIMAAALMTMTQCRKQETGSTARTVKMTITAGSGRTNIDEGTGAITWSEGDKLYVSDGMTWRGSLDLENGADTPVGTFTGDIEIGEGTTYHFFYLGYDNGMQDLPIGEEYEIGIYFGSQDGTLDDAMRYHMGHGKTGVTVDGNKATGHVMMSTKIAIAHFKFITDDAQPYTGSVTMSGDNINSYMYFYPDGNFYGSDNDGITIDDGDGISGDRYVTLIPIGEDAVEVEFIGDATGSMTFQTGILENKFYGMSRAIEVTLEPEAPKFSVSKNTTVEFARGNLYYNGSAFYFETSQTAYTTSWDSTHVDRFLWSPDKDVAVGTSTSLSGSTSDVFFTNATKTTASSNFQVSGEDAGTWRTLSKSEWTYLLNTANNSSGRRDANRFAKAMVSDVKGLLIFPDGYNNGVTISGINGVAEVNNTTAEYPSDRISDTKWAEMESLGVVFLPAAGYRNGTEFISVGSDGYYWASDAASASNASCVYFHSGYVSLNNPFIRSYGSMVRLVR